MLSPERYVAHPAPDRSCGPCTLCCKVYDVPAVESVAGAWCRPPRAGQGCAIHATRPEHCRAFHCLWMTEAWLGPEWKPDRAKMVLSIDPRSRNMNVQVDPGQANAWRREPYYGQLKRWAEASVPLERHVLIHVNKTTTVVLPDREVSLGILASEERIVSRARMTPQGPSFDIEKVRAA